MAARQGSDGGGQYLRHARDAKGLAPRLRRQRHAVPRSAAPAATLDGTRLDPQHGNPTALDSLLEVRVSDSEIYTNAHGRGAITYRSGDNVLTAHYVHQNAHSLFQSGTEKSFDPRDLISSAVTEMLFYPPFFRRIATELKREASAPSIPPIIDPQDDDQETRKEERAKRLGILTNSKFLNLAVDNQVTWPPVETVVNFEGYRLILMPPTREHSSVTNPSDPDELPELRRLHVAAHILRALARRFIRDELGVSECPYDGS
jgi:hypothetical protein